MTETLSTQNESEQTPSFTEGSAKKLRKRRQRRKKAAEKQKSADEVQEEKTPEKPVLTVEESGPGAQFPYTGKYTFVDVEIPNLNNDCICAIALIVVDEGREVLRHCELINPKTFFSANNIRIHHIHRKDVLDSRTLEEFWQDYGQYFEAPYIIGAHNAMSDISVLNKDLNRISRRIGSTQMVDTMDIMMYFYYKGEQKKGDLKLCNIAEHLEIPIDHHNPESDVNACYEIIRIMHGRFGMDLSPYIREIPDHPIKPPKVRAVPSSNQMRRYLAYTRKCIATQDERTLISLQAAESKGDKAFRRQDYEGQIFWYELAAARYSLNPQVYLRLSDLYEELKMSYDSCRILEKGIFCLKRRGKKTGGMQRILARRRKERARAAKQAESEE